MSEVKETLVHKVTLSSGKVVLLRELKIKHTKLAARAAGGKNTNNTALMGIEMQEELLRMLIAKVDEVVPSHAQLLDLDSLFSVSEYTQLAKVVSGMMGGDEGEPTVSMSSTGAQ